MLEIHIIELDKLTEMLEKKQISKNDKLTKWARFIINPKELEEKELKENTDIKKANEELSKIQKDEYEKWLAFSREMYVMDMAATKELRI